MAPRVHVWAQAAHAASFISVTLVLVCEIIRAIQELRYRRERVPTNVVVCRWYEPASDIPSKQQLSYITAPLWHLMNTATLTFLLLCDFPGRFMTSFIADNIWRGTGKAVGTWYQGSLQLLVASSIAATPANVFGDATLQKFRLASAYCLLGIAIINIIIGMVWQGEIRQHRFQTYTAFELENLPDEPPDECRENWKRMTRIMSGIHYLRDEDRQQMEKRLNKMKDLLAQL